jgi:hypothetical protein
MGDAQNHKYMLYGVLIVFGLSIAVPRLEGQPPENVHDILESCFAGATFLASLVSGRALRDPSTVAHKPFHLSPSFMNGWYGGVLGGAVAGLIVGPAYYFTARNGHTANWPELLTQIFGYAILAGFLLGAMGQLGSEVATHLAATSRAPAFAANEIVGGAIGGSLGGMFAGGYGGVVFGHLDTPVVRPGLLLTAGVVGAFAVCGGALFYDYRGRVRDLTRVFLFSLIPTFCAAMIGFSVLIWKNFGAHYFRKYDDTMANLRGGVYMGAIVGAVLGIQIGCTLLLYRLLNEPETAQAAGCDSGASADAGLPTTES